MTNGGPPLAGVRARKAAARLLGWYDRHARDLPWRRRPTPYKVWISEIMLQQTTVPAAAPYFTRFVRRFPTIAALARAREDEVLALWSGLGYYHRARHLAAAARVIADRHKGRIPSDIDALRALPGVGEYTAGAIRSIGFNLPAVALDANIVRVLARLGAVRGITTASKTRKGLAGLAAALMPAEHPSAFNQALMDLGAAICTPRAPRCDACPLARFCAARAAGAVDRIPQLRKPAAAVQVAMEALAVTREAASGGIECLLVQRGDGSLMRDLWEFPMIAGGDAARLGNGAGWGSAGHGIERIEDLATRLGARVQRRLGGIPHTITRHRIRIGIHAGRLVGGRLPSRRGLPAVRWVLLASFAAGRDGVASTGAARKIARHLSQVVHGDATRKQMSRTIDPTAAAEVVRRRSQPAGRPAPRRKHAGF
jgi:A/G-specific adenine glycosylase